MNNIETTKTKSHWVYKLSIAGWICLILGMSIKSSISFYRSVYLLLYKAGGVWLESGQLYYNEVGESSNFQYWPGFGAMLVPFSFLPQPVGSGLWTLINTSMLFLSCFMLAKIIFKDSIDKKYIGLFMLGVIPMSLEGLYNQQSNPLIIASIIFGVVALFKDRLYLASILLIIPGLIKIAPFCFALLILAMYPRKLIKHYLITLGALLVIPLALQDYNYVLQQYVHWFYTLSGEEGWRWAYRDAWVIWEYFNQGYVSNHVKVDNMEWYRFVQLGAAGYAALLCCYRRYITKIPEQDVLPFALAAGSMWLLLFGPSTELATCVVGAPALSWSLLYAWKNGSKLSKIIITTAFTVMSLGATGEIEFKVEWITGDDAVKLLLPIGGFIYAFWLTIFVPTGREPRQVFPTK